MKLRLSPILALTLLGCGNGRVTGDVSFSIGSAITWTYEDTAYAIITSPRKPACDVGGLPGGMVRHFQSCDELEEMWDLANWWEQPGRVFAMDAQDVITASAAFEPNGTMVFGDTEHITCVDRNTRQPESVAAWLTATPNANGDTVELESSGRVQMSVTVPHCTF